MKDAQVANPVPEATAQGAFISQCQLDYQLAEITAVAHTAPNTKKFTNLLAVVELLHQGLEPNPLAGPPPKQGGYPRSAALSPRAGRLYIQRWKTSVAEALDWYRACATGSMTVPGPTTPTIVQLPRLEGDPSWPHLVIEEHAFWEQSPFWGDRPGGSRWHRMIPEEPVDVTGGWNIGDFRKARSWLKDELHLDLFARSVLLGSCHLRLPNPIYRELSQRVRDDWRSIEFVLHPWHGQAANSLELILWNCRAWGATSVRRIHLAPGSNVLDVPEGVEQVAHATVCEKRGLLEQSEAAGFLTSVQVNMNLSTEQRRVQVPQRSKNGKPETYTVGVTGHTEMLQIGEPRAAHALSRLAADELQQHSAGLWNQLEVQWFDDNATGGRQTLRDIIGKARRGVQILDAYFGRKDLLDFALATTMHHLPVRILTSAQFCTTADDELKMEGGEALLRALESVRTQEPRLSIEIKVMAGKKAPVHDRFLIVDGVVWVLGASMNEFGDRGTLLLRLPTPPKSVPGKTAALLIPDEVFAKLWSLGDTQSPPLESWVEQRRQILTSRTRADRVRLSKEVLVTAWRRIGEVWRA